MSRSLIEHQPKGILSALRAACLPRIICDNWELREEAPESTVQPFRIERSPNCQALLIRPDQVRGEVAANQRLFPLFNSTVSRLTTCCDYILFGNTAPSTLTIVLIKLKSGSGSGTATQTDNAAILLQTLLSAAVWHAGLATPTLRWRSLILAGRAPKGSLHRPGGIPWYERSGPFGQVEQAICRPAACPLSALLT
jgi:hypothetical protein